MAKKNPKLVAFGNVLREIRTKVGISQENLAKIAGVHRNYIGILERGEQNASLLVIDKIATALNVSVSEFLSHYEKAISK